MDIEKQQLVQAPIDDVWDYTTDITRFPEWQSGVLEVEQLTEGELGEGTRALDVRSMFGRRVEQKMEITTFEPPHTFEARSLEGTMDLEVTYRFEEVDGGTRVEMRAHGDTTGVFKLADPILERLFSRQTEKELENLKDIIEHSQDDAGA